MSRLLFENSKFALGFAAVTLVGAGVLMGTDNSLSGVEIEGEDDSTASAQVASNVQRTTRPAPVAPPKDQPVIADWASDEELVDTAEGFDPSPEKSVEIIDAEDSGDSGSVSSNTPSASPKPGGAPAGGARPAGKAPSTPSAAKRNGALNVR